MKITKRQLRQIVREAVGSVGDVYFITDLGSSVPIERRNEDNPEKAFSILTSLPRYAVWGDTGVGKPQVVDSGDDLEELMTKYKLSPDSVKKI